MAEVLGVEGRSVRRWESSGARQMPPEDAWQLLDSCVERQALAVDEACAKVLEIADEQGSYPRTVTLSYWLSEGDYLQWSTDAQLDVAGDWRMANANARACAAALRSRGIDVAFGDGAGGVVSMDAE
jgi:hypothetical protein